MGLSWQQGPFSAHRAGRFLLERPLAYHVLYAEPADRRMRVELAGDVIAASDHVTLLHETDRYPVAYFPRADIDAQLQLSAKRTEHAVLGGTTWYSLNINGVLFDDVAWSHPTPPSYAAEMAGLVAFMWSEMDAFYEEDERIVGHAADPYHRVDVRASRRRLTVRLDGQVVADTRTPLVVFETGFAPRWYVPRADIRRDALAQGQHRTLCPYKGVAVYFDVVGIGARAPAAAWSYPHALPESARLEGYVSFDLEQVEVLVDGERLRPRAHQHVIAMGTDRDLAA